ncbi:MAG: EAL domain-containing protein [Bacilli bacterium]|nr:EAL domain-containing protein [Bacilli bacterium]
MVISKQKKKDFKKAQIFGGIFALIALPAIYFLVYYTGGIKYVYSHTMYIPIILSGLLFGPWIGFIVGIIGGLLLGPLMPIDALTGEPQLLINWMYRLLIFLVVGFISGFASKSLRNSVITIKKLLSHNQETNIPNTNFLKYAQNIGKSSKKTIATVLVNNHNSIIDVLGEGIYHKLLYALYEDLHNELPNGTIIVQADSNKFWIVKETTTVEADAEEIFKIITKAKVIESVPLYVEYSIGVSNFLNHQNFDSLDNFTQSDICARQAQIRQLNYLIQDNTKQKKRFEYDILMSFNRAIKHDETYLMYQPKIDLHTMKPIGLEALMRWNDPHHGEIGPIVFIPVIEQTRLINELTNWVLITTIKKIKEFCAKGISTVISINISAKNLIDPQFYTRTMQVIDESGINKNLLEFEITESAVMTNPEESRVILTKFAQKGIKIAIDDFGTGYSSLSYLSRFPINTIKIDKYFMKEIITNKSVQKIVKSTIELAKELGYQVLAEGIEEQEASNIVKAYDCDLAQGFYFAQPIKAEDIFAWYEEKLKDE